MSLSDVVRVNITADTQPIETAGFGLPLLVGYHDSDKFTEPVRRFGSLSEVEDAGISSMHPLHRAAAAVVAQSPRPPSFLIGRLGSSREVAVELKALRASASALPVEIHGTSASITGSSPELLAESLHTRINEYIASQSAPGISSEHDAGTTTVRVTGDYAIAGVQVAVPHGYFSRSESAPLDLADMDAWLDAIRAADDSWYAMIPAAHDEGTIKHLSTHANNFSKLAVCTSGDTHILDSDNTTDIASLLRSLRSARTALIYSHAPHSGIAAAWAASMLPTSPGSRTWNFARLQGGMPPTSFTTSARQALDDKRCNYYLQRAGLNVMATGILPDGNYIDTRRGLDFLHARMQESVFATLAKPSKVPFTDAGIAVVESSVRSVLQLGVQSGLLAADPAPTVSVPSALSVPQNDRAARRLRTVRFGARLAGAVHSIDIDGYVTV
jgi:hypothetical protein